MAPTTSDRRFIQRIQALWSRRTGAPMYVLVAALALSQSSPSSPAPAPSFARSVVDDAARHALLDASWIEQDPDFAYASDVKTTSHRIGHSVVVRATPIIDRSEERRVG